MQKYHTRSWSSQNRYQAPTRPKTFFSTGRQRCWRWSSARSFSRCRRANRETSRCVPFLYPWLALGMVEDAEIFHLYMVWGRNASCPAGGVLRCYRVTVWDIIGAERSALQMETVEICGWIFFGSWCFRSRCRAGGRTVCSVPCCVHRCYCLVSEVLHVLQACFR